MEQPDTRDGSVFVICSHDTNSVLTQLDRWAGGRRGERRGGLITRPMPASNDTVACFEPFY